MQVEEGGIFKSIATMGRLALEAREYDRSLVVIPHNHSDWDLPIEFTVNMAGARVCFDECGLATTNAEGYIKMMRSEFQTTKKGSKTWHSNAEWNTRAMACHELSILFMNVALQIGAQAAEEIMKMGIRLKVPATTKNALFQRTEIAALTEARPELLMRIMPAIPSLCPPAEEVRLARAVPIPSDAGKQFVALVEKETNTASGLYKIAAAKVACGVFNALCEKCNLDMASLETETVEE